jgi:hypothetical protein
VGAIQEESHAQGTTEQNDSYEGSFYDESYYYPEGEEEYFYGDEEDYYYYDYEEEAPVSSGGLPQERSGEAAVDAVEAADSKSQQDPQIPSEYGNTAAGRLYQLI